jgi:hypothetical protein
MYQPTLSVLLLTATLMCLSILAEGESAREPRGIHRFSSLEKSEVVAELTSVVEAFISAGERNDPSARGGYLAPSVFYYGHTRTHAQALKEIARLYRRWPERKFSPVESIDVFEVPQRRGVYRVTAVYEYKFDNLDEHLSGKSKLTCVVEHDAQGSRIIGLDEKLISNSTQYRRD